MGCYIKWAVILIKWAVIFIAITFFVVEKLKLFISLEWKYNELQFGLRISSIEVSKQKLCIATLLYVYNKTYDKEIHPGMTPFLRSKGLTLIPGKLRCLHSFPMKKGFQERQ